MPSVWWSPTRSLEHAEELGDLRPAHAAALRRGFADHLAVEGLASVEVRNLSRRRSTVRTRGTDEKASLV